MAKHLRSIVHRPDLMKPAARPLGLGDAVAAVAQPIARAIDAVAGTNVQGCGGCKQRQADWNRKVPDVLRPFG